MTKERWLFLILTLTALFVGSMSCKSSKYNTKQLTTQTSDCQKANAASANNTTVYLPFISYPGGETPPAPQYYDYLKTYSESLPFKNCADLNTLSGLDISTRPYWLPLLKYAAIKSLLLSIHELGPYTIQRIPGNDESFKNLLISVDQELANTIAGITPKEGENQALADFKKLVLPKTGERSLEKILARLYDTEINWLLNRDKILANQRVLAGDLVDAAASLIPIEARMNGLTHPADADLLNMDKGTRLAILNHARLLKKRTNTTFLPTALQTRITNFLLNKYSEDPSNPRKREREHFVHNFLNSLSIASLFHTSGVDDNGALISPRTTAGEIKRITNLWADFYPIDKMNANRNIKDEAINDLITSGALGAALDGGALSAASENADLLIAQQEVTNKTDWYNENKAQVILDTLGNYKDKYADLATYETYLKSRTDIPVPGSDFPEVIEQSELDKYEEYKSSQINQTPLEIYNSRSASLEKELSTAFNSTGIIQDLKNLIGSIAVENSVVNLFDNKDLASEVVANNFSMLEEMVRIQKQRDIDGASSNIWLLVISIIVTVGVAIFAPQFVVAVGLLFFAFGASDATDAYRTYQKTETFFFGKIGNYERVAEAYNALSVAIAWAALDAGLTGAEIAGAMALLAPEIKKTAEVVADYTPSNFLTDAQKLGEGNFFTKAFNKISFLKIPSACPVSAAGVQASESSASCKLFKSFSLNKIDLSPEKKIGAGFESSAFNLKYKTAAIKNENWVALINDHLGAIRESTLWPKVKSYLTKSTMGKLEQVASSAEYRTALDQLINDAPGNITYALDDLSQMIGRMVRKYTKYQEAFDKFKDAIPNPIPEPLAIIRDEDYIPVGLIIEKKPGVRLDALNYSRFVEIAPTIKVKAEELLHFLHSRGIAHGGDLHYGNILWDESTSQVSFIDFAFPPASEKYKARDFKQVKETIADLIQNPPPTMPR